MRLKLFNLYLLIIIMPLLLMSGCSSKNKNINMDNYLQEISELSIPDGVKIVGMGEATHGNSEFTILKKEVFKTLVEKYGYKLFALEGDFGGCQVVNEYIKSGKGTAEDAVKAIGFAIYKTKEMVDLVEWMRQYNQKATEGEKLGFYGFDMQRYDNNKNGLLSYIEKVDKNKSEAYKVSLTYLNDETVFNQTKEKIQTGLAVIEKVLSEMEQNKDIYISKSSPSEYALACQYALCIKENATLRGTNVNYSETRDKFMAEKVQWILNYYEQYLGGETLFIAGHNGHIEKTSASPAGYTSTGQRLSQAFGEKYFAIGTDFYENSFLSNTSSGERKEFSLKNNKSDLIKLFEKSNREVGLLDIKSALKDEGLGKILSSKQRMGNVGDDFSAFSRYLPSAYTIRMVPAKAYDAVIFVRKATPSTML